MFKALTIDNLDKFPDLLEILLNSQREKINEISVSNYVTYDEILKPLQDLDEELSIFFTPLSHLNSVMNSNNTQKAYEKSLPLLSKFSSEIAQNEKLFKKIENIEAETDEKKKVVIDEVKGFILSGINLAQDDKKRLEDISLKLSELSNQFSQNLLDATNSFELIIKDKKDVASLPQTDIDLAKTEIDGEVVYKFTLQIPSFLAYTTYGDNREYREVLYKAYSTRASENSEVIDNILRLKKDKASILGFDSYADYALETKDAPNAIAVISFLEDLAFSAKDSAKDELKELKDFAKKLDDLDSLESYDIAYYSEKLKKEKFDFDDSMTKPYFEQNRVLNGLLDIVSELFNVRFKLVDIKSWHSDVKIFDIYENNNISGRIYFDLTARKEKRGGAWMNDFETHYIDSDNHQRLASAFVVCNFSPASDTSPSLLRHDDVVTLFHEMGHAIHHLFGKSKERSVSGINGVAWDVVEFPSQFLENFAYEEAIIKRFGFHYNSNEAIPIKLINKIKESKNFQASMGILRQVEFSLFDFKLHQSLYQADEVQDLLDKVRDDISVVTPPKYNKFQNGFAHIFAGGYSAGYYSYKWAEVLSADAFFECIDKTNGFNKEKAKGYKEFILSKGGSQDMSELYYQWLGRKADVKSLLKLYSL